MFSRVNRFTVSVFFLIFLLVPAGAAEVHINIERTESPRIAMGILGFQSDGGGETDTKGARDVLSADLRRSMAFNLADLPGIVSAPDMAPVVIQKAAEGKTEIILSGRVKVEKEQIRLDVTLYNGKSGKSIWERQFTGLLKDFRRVSHAASDKIVYQITGEAGISQTEIAYVSDEGGSKEVYRMDYDGYNPRLLTLNRTINLFPRWSPDGHKISYTSFIDKNPDIWIYDVTTARRWKMATGGLRISATWFPDGKKVLFAGSVEGMTQLFTAREDGTNIQRLSFSGGNDLSPSFSPAGREVVFNSDRGGGPQLYLMNGDGTNVRRLTFEGDYNTTPSWSPTGDWIAYTCRVDGRLRICLISPDGQKKKSLSPPSNYDDESPVWAPDGRHLAFSSNREGKQDIYMMTSEGTEVEKLTARGGNHINPAWSPVRY